MFYINVFFILLHLQYSLCTVKTNDTDNIQNILMDEERNARCCAKHLDCCRNCTETTSFEVRALLIKCVKSVPCNCEKSTTYMDNNRKVVKNEGCGSEEKSVPREIAACDKKLKLTVKIKNVGVTNTKNQYIIIDHVFDPLTEKRQKLLNPYVLKIKQQPILQVYGLNFENMVNSEAKEKVINKNNEGYTGCSTDPQNPTCGSMKYEDETVPFSTGFCCPCTNNEHNGKNIQEDYVNNANGTIKKVRDIYNIDIPAPKNNLEDNEFTGTVAKIKGWRELNVPNSVPDNLGLIQNLNSLGPIDVNGHIIQKRGGQDCTDNFTPPNVNPDTYHDSTHCLEFSDLWYSIYNLQEPKLYHSLQFQIYEKCQDQDGSYKWVDLTKNFPVISGTNNKFYSNEENSLVANYMAREINSNMFAINHKIKKLLIPDASKIVYNDSYPEVTGGPEEYLVVNENQIQPNGKSCNTAGVGYEAFVKQPHRCSKPRGTCLLKNQPKQLWTHDHEAEVQGRKGYYFLKYFSPLTENPVESCENSQNKTLKLQYTQSYTSILDLEVKADANIVLRPNSLAIITEVYVESSSLKQTSIIVKVFNAGLVSSLFFVSLTQCPLDLPASFSNIVSKPALIAPQHQHVFNLKIECPLPINTFFCAIEVLNSKEELIAFRKIRFEKLDRCICIWHCSCACLLTDNGLKCKPMSLQHYHAAGFQGSLPVELHIVEYTFFDDMMSLLSYIIIFLFLTLLIMGLTKAFVGCLMVAVSLWGLDVVLDLPKKMNSYYELDLKHRKVIYDKNGWPIHPDTKERVRNVSLPAEFSINIVFFFVYPFALLCSILKKICCSSYSTSYDDYDECTCKTDTLFQKRSSSLQISINKKQPSTESAQKETKENEDEKLEPGEEILQPENEEISDSYEDDKDVPNK